MNRIKIAAIALAGLMIVGCEKKDNSANTANTSTSDTAGSANTASSPTTAPTFGTAVTDQMNKAASSAQSAAVSAQTQMNSATSSASDTAKAKLLQVEELVGQKKYDAADAALKEVESMKSSLPQAMQDEVTSLRTQLNAAKAAQGSGISVPSLGK